jgi:hypothetical protein
MPSDRSTLPRGFSGGADQQSAWQEPTAPAGRRLPSAPRERKPALAALAVLLILGCALGTGFLVIQSGKRVAAIEISQSVGSGQQIPLSAMQEVQIASDTSLSYVPWSEAGQVSRFFAATAIPPGTLLTRGMVSGSNTSASGRTVMGLALKDGQLPRGLEVGDHVDIYQVSDATETCPGRSGTTLSANAIVLAINAPEAAAGSSAEADVDVALNPANAGAVACNAANGIVGVAILPAGVLPNNGRGAAPAAGPSTTPNPGASTTPGPNTSGRGARHPRGKVRPSSSSSSGTR